MENELRLFFKQRIDERSGAATDLDGDINGLRVEIESGILEELCKRPMPVLEKVVLIVGVKAVPGLGGSVAEAATLKVICDLFGSPFQSLL